MDYFPLFMRTNQRRILMVGGSVDIVHKLRLVMKTAAAIHVFGTIEDEQIALWRDDESLIHHDRAVSIEDTKDACFAYICGSDPERRDGAMAIFDEANLPYCVIDDLSRSHFITPALIDRDPVVVAIGSEGTSPVITRKIKAELEGILPEAIGTAARVAGEHRPAAETLPKGSARRQFWTRYFDEIVPRVVADFDQAGDGDLAALLTKELEQLIKSTKESTTEPESSHVLPMLICHDADLLTRKAMRILHDADVVAYDEDVPRAILELARRESQHIVVKAGQGKEASTKIEGHIKAGLKAIYLSLGKVNLDEDELAESRIYIDVLPYVPPLGSTDEIFPMLPRSLATSMQNKPLRKI